MRKSRLIFLGLLVQVALLCVIVSCKRKYDNEFIGPKVKNGLNVKIVEPFEFQFDSVSFANDTVARFKGKFDQVVKWQITITGTNSCAEKNIYGVSANLDSVIYSWDGSQDSLYYFRSGEVCQATLKIGDNVVLPKNDVTNALDIRNELVTAPVVASDLLKIKLGGRRSTPAGQFELMPRKIKFMSDRTFQFYEAGYDREAAGDVEYFNIEKDPSIGYGGTSYGLEIVKYDPLSRAKCGEAINGDGYFILRGTDKVSIDTTNPDYYIGRLSSPNLLKPTSNAPNVRVYGKLTIITDTLVKYSPDDIYFSVFVYGDGSGAKINYTVKEDENGDYISRTSKIKAENDDESWEYAIPIDFVGWKLITIRYSDFTLAFNKYGASRFGDGVKEVKNIAFVQFGMVAPKPGGTAQMIIDNPVVSWGRPFKY